MKKLDINKIKNIKLKNFKDYKTYSFYLLMKEFDLDNVFNHQKEETRFIYNYEMSDETILFYKRKIIEKFLEKFKKIIDLPAKLTLRKSKLIEDITSYLDSYQPNCKWIDDPLMDSHLFEEATILDETKLFSSFLSLLLATIEPNKYEDYFFSFLSDEHQPVEVSFNHYSFTLHTDEDELIYGYDSTNEDNIISLFYFDLEKDATNSFSFDEHLEYADKVMSKKEILPKELINLFKIALLSQDKEAFTELTKKKKSASKIFKNSFNLGDTDNSKIANRNFNLFRKSTHNKFFFKPNLSNVTITKEWDKLYPEIRKEIFKDSKAAQLVFKIVSKYSSKTEVDFFSADESAHPFLMIKREMYGIKNEDYHDEVNVRKFLEKFINQRNEDHLGSNYLQSTYAKYKCDNQNAKSYFFSISDIDHKWYEFKRKTAKDGEPDQYEEDVKNNKVKMRSNIQYLVDKGIDYKITPFNLNNNYRKIHYENFGSDEYQIMEIEDKNSTSIPGFLIEVNCNNKFMKELFNEMNHGGKHLPIGMSTSNVNNKQEEIWFLMHADESFEFSLIDEAFYCTQITPTKFDKKYVGKVVK